MTLVDSVLPLQQLVRNSFGMPVLPLTVLLILVSLFLVNHVLSIPDPKGIPLIRERPGAKRFSLRNYLAYYSGADKLYEEAYHGVSLGPPQSSYGLYIYRGIRGSFYLEIQPSTSG